MKKTPYRVIVWAPSGVGRACTESFVASFIAIIILNFFFANLLQSLYVALYGVHGVFD